MVQSIKRISHKVREAVMDQQGKLIDRLPKVRGRLIANAPISKYTWFRVGGTAEVLFKPADVEDLSFFLQAKPKNIPVLVIGVGSNLLVRDGGVKGVVIRLGRHFNNIFVESEEIEIGAGVLDRTLALAMCEAGLTGLEFLCGIPGTIGGALRMNAGAYGSEIKDVFVSGLVMDLRGQLHRLTLKEMDFSYRHCGVPEDMIFIGARLRAKKGDKKKIAERIEKLLSERDDSQPVRSRTGGSTFANPEGQKAWKLIDEAGCRGLTCGGAKVSEMHCNFLINTGNATAADLERLGEKVRQKVQAKSGLDLRWEIRRVGEFLTSPIEKVA